MIVRPETRQHDNLFIDVLTKHKACAEIKTNHTEVYYELWLQKSDTHVSLNCITAKNAVTIYVWQGQNAPSHDEASV